MKQYTGRHIITLICFPSGENKYRVPYVVHVTCIHKHKIHLNMFTYVRVQTIYTSIYVYTIHYIRVVRVHIKYVVTQAVVFLTPILLW